VLVVIPHHQGAIRGSSTPQPSWLKVVIQWPTTHLEVQPVEQRVPVLELLNSAVVMVLMADQQVEELVLQPALLLLEPMALGRTAEMLLLVVVMVEMEETLDSLQGQGLQDLHQVVEVVVPKETLFPVTKMEAMARMVASCSPIPHVLDLLFPYPPVHQLYALEEALY